MNRILLSLLVLFCLGAAAQTKDELFEAGQKTFRQKDYEEAITYYSKAIALDNQFIKAYLNRSNAYLELDETKKALSDVNTVLVIDPGSAIAYNNRGKIYQQQKKYREAIADYNKAINIKKDYFVAYSNKIKSLLSLGKTDEARLTLETLLAEFPENAQVYIVSASYFELINDSFSALQELDKAVDKDKTITSLQERAAFKDRFKDGKGAIHDYSQLIIQNPKEPLFYYGRSSSYYDLKDYSNSISNADIAISLDKSYYSAYLIRAASLEAEGKIEEAVADYEKAITVSPDREAAYLQLSKIYSSKNNAAKALSTVNRILLANPKNKPALEYRADLELKTKDLKRAIADYAALIQLEPSDATYYYYKAKAEDLLSDKTAACMDIKKAQQLIKNKISAEYVVVHNYLYLNCRNLFSQKLLKINDLSNEAVRFVSAGQLDKAVKNYDAIVKLAPDSASVYYERGKLKRQASDHIGAIADYKKALDLNKNFTEAWAGLGVSYQLIEKNEDAITAYAEAIRSDPDYALPYYNIGVLYEAREEYTKAIRYLETAVAKDTAYTKGYFELGSCYLKIKDKEKACYYLKKAEALGSVPARIKVISECN